MRVNRPRSAEERLARLDYCFRDWNDHPLTAISTGQVEAWKTKRLKAGRRPATVHRDLADLSAALSHAVRLEHLQANPVHRVQKPRLDRTPNVRFLDPDEEQALRYALKERDRKLEAARDSANDLRRERRYTPKPRLEHYGDPSKGQRSHRLSGPVFGNPSSVVSIDCSMASDDGIRWKAALT